MSYNGKAASPDDERGTGFILDLIFNRRHSLTVNYYLFTEIFPATSSLLGAIDRFSGLSIGYRYFFPFDFYIGGEILSLGGTSIAQDYILNGVAGDLETMFKTVSVPALTLGYNYVFPKGFSIGPHLFLSWPANWEIESITHNGDTLSFSSVQLEDLSIVTLGLNLGYSW